jgi:hypothetical protein
MSSTLRNEKLWNIPYADATYFSEEMEHGTTGTTLAIGLVLSYSLSFMIAVT